MKIGLRRVLGCSTLGAVLAGFSLVVLACAAGKKSTDTSRFGPGSDAGLAPSASPSPTPSSAAQQGTMPSRPAAAASPLALSTSKPNPEPSASSGVRADIQHRPSPKPTPQQPKTVGEPKLGAPLPKVSVRPSPLAQKSPIILSHTVPAATPTAAPKANSGVPEELAAIEEVYQKSGTVAADFTQTSKSAATGIEKVTRGKLLIKRPNKVRWETTEPDPNLMVSDGKLFWFYTPPFDASEGGQVIVKRTGQVQSKLAHALIAGSFSQSVETKMVKLEKKSERTFTLTPKSGRAGTVKSALIEIDPVAKRIKRVILDHKDGNRAEIELHHIVLGGSLPDSRFQFVAPHGTVVIDADR